MSNDGFKKLSAAIGLQNKTLTKVNFPTTVNGIDMKQKLVEGITDDGICGDSVLVEVNHKMYDGYFLGEISDKVYIFKDTVKNNLRLIPSRKPAIFIPELKRMVFANDINWVRK